MIKDPPPNPLSQSVNTLLHIIIINIINFIIISDFNRINSKDIVIK